MARKKTSNSKSYLKTQISVRLRQIRLELFGEHGGPELARRLDIPARTWYNYETGVTVPAEVMLSFIDQTSLNTAWLLTGEGPVFRNDRSNALEPTTTPLQWIRRGLEQLELESQARDQSFKALSAYLDAEAEKEFVSLPILELEETPGFADTRLAQRDVFKYYRPWVPHPENSFCLFVEDSAMEPLLKSGSLVVVDQTQKTLGQRQGKILLALDPKGVPIIRRLQQAGEFWVLLTDQPNRDFPMITFSPSEAEHRVLGEIICVNGRLES